MIFTLGHSTSTEQEFVSAARGIDIIVDIRSHPGSRSFPRYNRELMEKWLPKRGLDYEWMPGLGGWTQQHLAEYQEPMTRVGVDVAAYARSYFPKGRIATNREEAKGPAWTNLGLYDYSWYMTTDDFLGSIDHLIHTHGPDDVRVALVCAEAQWWRCHRSMVADYLTWLGIPCFHLPVKPPRHEARPRFVAHADVIGSRLERYDPAIIERWKEWDSLEKASE